MIPYHRILNPLLRVIIWTLRWDFFKKAFILIKWAWQTAGEKCTKHMSAWGAHAARKSAKPTIALLAFLKSSPVMTQAVAQPCWALCSSSNERCVWLFSVPGSNYGMEQIYCGTWWKCHPTVVSRWWEAIKNWWTSAGPAAFWIKTSKRIREGDVWHFYQHM